jgi:hypothetical protein
MSKAPDPDKLLQILLTPKNIGNILRAIDAAKFPEVIAEMKADTNRKSEGYQLAFESMIECMETLLAAAAHCRVAQTHSLETAKKRGLWPVTKKDT